MFCSTTKAVLSFYIFHMPEMFTHEAIKIVMVASREIIRRNKPLRGSTEGTLLHLDIHTPGDS
jgi:hypothetical protein